MFNSCLEHSSQNREDRSSTVTGSFVWGLSIGIGFTQVPEMFAIFPEIIRTICAENCVAVVFVAAILLNLLMPKEKAE